MMNKYKLGAYDVNTGKALVTPYLSYYTRRHSNDVELRVSASTLSAWWP